MRFDETINEDFELITGSLDRCMSGVTVAETFGDTINNFEVVTVKETFLFTGNEDCSDILAVTEVVFEIG